MRSYMITAAIAVAVFAAFAVTGDAMAQAFFSTAESKATEALQSIRTIFYVAATLAVVVSAIMALGGRWPWSRFFTIFGAVFVVAVVDQIITWLGGAGA